MKLPWKRNKLQPAPEGNSDFWATVEVRLHDPIEINNDNETTFAVGYFRNFGVRANNDSVRQILEAEVSDGDIDWSQTEWHSVDPNSLEPDIRSRIKPVAGQGVWYFSGRFFYPADRDDAAN